jgi:uncharacterized NAD(P)/FAD-binding protein YdhS
MPALPTFTVTDAQAQRLLAAFGSVDNYKAWLKEQLVRYVVDHEINQDREEFEASVRIKRTEIEGSLGT